MRGRRISISSSLAKMTVVPILFLGIISSIFGIFWIKSSMETEVEQELAAQAHLAVTYFATAYSGDYAVYSSDDEILVIKGDTILNSNYQMIDSLKEASGTDFTLFLGNMRILTTLKSHAGVRLTGTLANEQIVDEVLGLEQDQFYKDVDVFGVKYYAYYTPLFNSDGTCVGMIATLMPDSGVYYLIFRAVLPIVILTVLAAIFSIFWAFYYSKDFKSTIKRLSENFHKVSEGTLSNTVAPDLLSRKDEFGDMAHSVVNMQLALRKLVEEDMLTGLANRRCGQSRLEQAVEQANENNTVFSLALGDIDFFKKFNDTYGHDCGDLVLKEVSRLIKKCARDHGVSVRWGGEEFLIIFTRGEYDEHKKLLEHLLDSIRKNVVTYQGQELSVTMTFGLISTEGMNTADDMVKKVDNLLYYGKEHGRNRLVTMDEYCE